MNAEYASSNGRQDETMNEQQTFECSTCGQTVQGWNAVHGPYGVRCCNAPDYQEFTPEAAAFEELEGGVWGAELEAQQSLAFVSELLGFALLGAELEAHPNKAFVSELPLCNLCADGYTRALYDGKTIYGPWAYMCQPCFNAYGVGLGTGKGQRLIVSVPTPTKEE